MKNTLKKLGAIALVLMLMMSLSVTAFAADMDDQSGKIGEFTSAENLQVQQNTVTIYKELISINPTSTSVYAPAISYSYSIAPGAAGSTITDSQGVLATVKAGLTGATITSSVSWTNADADKLTTSPTGAANRKAITVDFSGVSWTGAGVYRYVITETATGYAASSVTEGDTSHTRYMDVYVKDADSGYEIYGYVCFVVNGNITSANEAVAKKTEGFVNTTDNAADKYYTYDLEITKTVVNDRAMQNHDWPFTVTFTAGTGVTATNFKLDTAFSSAALGSGYAGALTSDTPTVKHGGSVKYIGIPYGTSVTIKEKVDVAGTTYKVTSTGADMNINDNAVVGTAAGTDTSNATVNAQTTTSLVKKTVAVNNEMLIISPTGVVMRVAPYALMLIGGIVLLVISRRRKAEEA